MLTGAGGATPSAGRNDKSTAASSSPGLNTTKRSTTPSPFPPSGNHQVCWGCAAATPAAKPRRFGLSEDWMRPATMRAPRPRTTVDTSSSR